MLTSLLEVSALWLPIVGALLIVGGTALYVLFLFTLTETLNRVRPEARELTTRQVWLNLIPLFHLAWLFVTVARLSSSVRKEIAARELHNHDDGGRWLGLAFATTCLLTLVPGVNLLAGPAALVLWLLYWNRVVQLGKRLETPGETGFLERYNARLEFPTSMAIAALNFALLIALGLVLLPLFARGPDRGSIPILTLNMDGQDATGLGSVGSGGDPLDPLRTGEPPTQKDFAAIPADAIAQVLDDLKSVPDLADPTATAPISLEQTAAIALLDEAVRKKLYGQKPGKGPQAGTGEGPQPGDGIGGIGSDSTRARSLRWVLRFRTLDGKDYLMQLKALGATVLVPLASDKKEMYIFRDLDNPKPGTLATDADYAILARQIQFNDFRRESTKQVAAALGLDFVPSVFCAFFPKQLEVQLARLETNYRNRRSQDIAETVFEVTVRGGQYQLVVTDQTAMR